MRLWKKRINQMRTKPYTAIGIKRKKCIRCGKQAATQWQICSDGNQYRPLCTDCDIELNKTVLEFMGFKNSEKMIENYKLKINKEEK